VTERRGRKRNKLLDDLNERVLIFFFVPWTPFESLVKLTDHFSETQWS